MSSEDDLTIDEAIEIAYNNYLKTPCKDNRLLWLYLVREESCQKSVHEYLKEQAE